jgi:hypothetical protein
MSNSTYMEKNYKVCFGMLMLKKRYGVVPLEATCTLVLTGMRINNSMITSMNPPLQMLLRAD